MPYAKNRKVDNTTMNGVLWRWNYLTSYYGKLNDVTIDATDVASNFDWEAKLEKIVTLFWWNFSM